jgi:hypothetical protein
VRNRHFFYTMVFNLEDFTPKQANLRILLKNVLRIFLTNIWTFKVFFLLRVGNLVFTVLVLFNEKYREMNNTANPTLLNF